MFTPSEDIEDRLNEIQVDLTILLAILRTRYVQPRLPIPKAGNLHLAFRFAGTRMVGVVGLGRYIAGAQQSKNERDRRISYTSYIVAT